MKQKKPQIDLTKVYGAFLIPFWTIMDYRLLQSGISIFDSEDDEEENEEENNINKELTVVMNQIKKRLKNKLE
jgi:hypothetical protein